MRKTLFALAIACLFNPALIQAAPHALDVIAANARINAGLNKSYPRLERLYQDIHSHPEIGFQETRTASLLAGQMRKLGFTVTERVGGTGIVAIYKNGEGPTVFVRTELDALPMEEKTGLPYASRAQQVVDGKPSFVAHSCGHDVHMTWWLGTAEALVAMKNQWRGTLMFVGQPSEENLGGAKAMLADGLFNRWPKPDYGFGAHVSPRDVGTVVVKDGTLSSAADQIFITFHGRGAHGSMPDKSIDPIVIASHFVSDVQTVISREKPPGSFGVVTVGAFQAGTVANIIPDKALLKLTLRSHDEATRKLLIAGVVRTAQAAAQMAGAPVPTIDFVSGTAAVVNDSALAAQSAAIMAQVFGADSAFAPAYLPGGEASEDYSAYIAAGVPSVFFGIGGLDPKMLAEHAAAGKPIPVNHSPYFAPMPEPTIRRGIETLTLAVLMVAGGTGRGN